MKSLKEKFVIAYYGDIYIEFYANPNGWTKKYVGTGIVDETVPLDYYPNTELIMVYEPDEDWIYAKIEKRYYPVEEE